MNEVCWGRPGVGAGAGGDEGAEQGSGGAARPERPVCGAAQEADYCSGAGGQPLHRLHGRAHLR